MRGPAARRAVIWVEASPAGEGRRGKPCGVTIASASLPRERRSARPGGPLSLTMRLGMGDPCWRGTGHPPRSRRLSTGTSPRATSQKQECFNWP